MNEPLMSVATGGDLPRQVATSPDEYTLTIEDALVRYEHAGHPRTARSIQRYCANGELDCLRQQTTFGDKFRITPASVARHIAQIVELASATSSDQTRQVATSRDTIPMHSTGSDIATTSIDTPRPVATGRDTPAPQPVVVDQALPSSGMTQSSLPGAIEKDAGEIRVEKGSPDFDIYEHPYVKKLEARCSSLEEKYDNQVRRTEEIQIRSQEQLIELQRMVQVGQSETLANFFLKAKDSLFGSLTAAKPGPSTTPDETTTS